jgi:hypothetical protein
MVENRGPRGAVAGGRRGGVRWRRRFVSLLAGLLAAGTVTAGGMTIANADEPLTIPFSISATNNGAFSSITEVKWKGADGHLYPTGGTLYLYVNQSGSMTVDVPLDAQQVDVLGEAVLGKKGSHSFSVEHILSDTNKCFRYSGTTLINFSFEEVPC